MRHLQDYHTARPARRVAGLEILKNPLEGEGGVTSLVVTGGTEGVTGRYAYRGVSVQPGWPGSDSGVNKLY